MMLNRPDKHVAVTELSDEDFQRMVDAGLKFVEVDGDPAIKTLFFGGPPPGVRKFITRAGRVKQRHDLAAELDERAAMYGIEGV